MGKHDRSRGRAKWTGETWVSRCRRCDVALIRLLNGKWVELDADAPQAALVAPAPAKIDGVAEQDIVFVDDGEIVMPDEATLRPTPEPGGSPRRSVFHRTMRYLWFGRG